MGESTYLNNPPGARPIQRPHATHLGLDVPLVIAVAALIIFGLLMVYSASWNVAIRTYDNASYIVINQIKWVLVGLVAAAVLSRLNYRRFTAFALPLMAVTLGMLILVFLIGRSDGVSRSLFKGSIQPSELAKFALIVYLAVWLNTKRELLNSLSLGLVPLMTIIGLLVVLILAQPDFSAALTIFLLGIFLFILAGGEIRHIAMLVFFVAVFGALLYLISSKAQTRIHDYIFGLLDPQQASYHIQRCTEAIVRGGFFGVGIGKGTTKFTNLPVPWTDSIFAIIAEETGLLGCIMIIGLYLVLLWRGLSIARRAPDVLGQLLAAGITIWIVTEAMINVGVIVNLAPFAGNALPLISAGGSNMVTTLAALGVLINISRSTSLEPESNERKAFSAIVDLRRRDRGRRISRSDRPASTR
ncbi:MAG: cell division protein FtsW [Anaerolineaceae bacterium]|nr:cell division protein FtsW [Anaerolineaceae bacterium]